MNSNWRNRPTQIDFVDSKIDWIIAIDESGSSDLNYVKSALAKGNEIVHSEKHLTVTACLISARNFNAIKDSVMAVKNTFWENGLFNYPSGLKRVCFHLRDIRRREGAFSTSTINCNEFANEIGNLIRQIPIKLYVANVDKEKHVKKYKYPDSPYELCTNFILERIMFNIPQNETCVLLFEAIGEDEDKRLLEETKRLILHGNNYNGKDKFQKIQGVYFNPKWCKNENCQKSYWPLEIADLCAYPIHKKIAYGSVDVAYEIVEKKIANYPDIYGFGLKLFP